MNIAVAGTGYLDLSIATVLAQHNHVIAFDVVFKKVDLINQKNHPFRMSTLRSIWLRRN